MSFYLNSKNGKTLIDTFTVGKQRNTLNKSIRNKSSAAVYLLQDKQIKERKFIKGTRRSRVSSLLVLIDIGANDSGIFFLVDKDSCPMYLCFKFACYSSQLIRPKHRFSYLFFLKKTLERRKRRRKRFFSVFTWDFFLFVRQRQMLRLTTGDIPLFLSLYDPVVRCAD